MVWAFLIHLGLKGVLTLGFQIFHRGAAPHSLLACASLWSVDAGLGGRGRQGEGQACQKEKQNPDRGRIQKVDPLMGVPIRVPLVV